MWVGCQPTGPDICTGGIDEDCDGLIDCDDPDCLGDMSCSIDHFKCYKAKTKRGTEKFVPRDIKLSDQFKEKLTKVMSPVAICNPVDKEGEGIKDPNDRLTCYKIKDAKTEPRQDKFQRQDVVMRNQFGMDTLEVVKPLSLCVPSSKTQVGPAK